ncbi:MAG: hypothetical protein AMXMBFR33_06920 [Candidatus Xenobia bacterium]
MSWTCPHCSAVNSAGDRHCIECNARLPFEVPSELQEPQAEEPFLVPRRGELTAALRQGLADFRAGQLPTPELIGRLRRALTNVPAVFAAMAGKLGELQGEAYAQEVLVSLGDSQALFEAGLAEMLQGVESNDDGPLRFGWLLVEKGEDEYIRILETLRRDAGGGPFTGQPDALARLLDARERGELDAEGLRLALDQLEQHLAQVVEESLGEIRQGLQQARSFDGADLRSVEQARQSLRQAAQGLAQALLSVG